MWSDNETSRDFLNFASVADTAAEMIYRAKGKPLSMGVSGGWGAGKSSMVKLMGASLSHRFGNDFIFVEFNAWLYQGFDDAKAALMEVIAEKLVAHAEEHKKGLEEAKDFLERINWVRATGIAVSAAAAVVAGVPPVGLLGNMWGAARGLFDGDVTYEDVKTAEVTAKKAGETGKGLIRDKKRETPPKEIHNLREHFKETLNKMEVTLIVFVDDLDRCLPATAISTLEAIRLFLFIDRTAFVIAADEKMIRQAVKAHFKADLEDDLVTNYFDKLIQIPIRVPPLGTQEVRAYLFLLFIENSEVEQIKKDTARKAICKQLGESWQGKRVDKDYVISVVEGCPDALKNKFDLADRIAPLMTTSRQIRGNPRLIKRFLNTLSIRLTTASAQNVTVDEAVLAKMLLFERCGNEKAYSKLVKTICDNEEGKAEFLKPWEEAARRGEKADKIEGLDPDWNDEFCLDWLALAPSFYDLDLRAVVYVSREHMPIIGATDQLTSGAAKAMEALLVLKNSAPTALVESLKSLGKRELSVLLDKLLQRAKRIQEWAAPPILHACLAVVAAEPSLGEVLARFLDQIPVAQLKTPIVPILKDKPWAQKLLPKWESDTSTPMPVRKAIQAEMKGGK